jgi:hypothetical protein
VFDVNLHPHTRSYRLDGLTLTVSKSRRHAELADAALGSLTVNRS